MFDLLVSKKTFILPIFAVSTFTLWGQRADMEVQTGQFTPDWESLSNWECPEWFKDAKFGIWAHWGPQCNAEAGDWYARGIYEKGSGAYNWHTSHYGDPAEYGLKDLCNDWKAENWNPEELINLYKSVGARFFMTLGNHHDNFDLWDSPYQEWNSVNIGPRKDIVKGWSDACKKAGMPMGVSIHASHTWTWLEPSQEFDGNLTKEDGYKPNPDGTEKWWKGLDPQELYAQRHPRGDKGNTGMLFEQWDWGGGASQPSEEYKRKFQNRVIEMITDYEPDMIYFDDTAMPFYGCDDSIGQNILAHYYNSAARHNGLQQVVATGKQLTDDQKRYMMWDVERGIPDKMQTQYWQTCTCIGEWHYNRNLYDNNGYKSGATVVRMLVDIISKNGNLLLSVPVRSDGTIDDKERATLADIKDWMDINSESVYGTRVWKTFGEGPLSTTSRPLSNQGFNEGILYTNRDVRFVQKDGTVYATIMAWPEAGEFTFESFGFASKYNEGEVAQVNLLGHGPVAFKQDARGLTVEIPESKPNDIAPVFAIKSGNTTHSDYEELSMIVATLEPDFAIKDHNPINTGKLNSTRINEVREALAEGKKISKKASHEKIAVVKDKIVDAYHAFKTDGINKGGGFDGEYAEDVTAEYLVESENFSRETGGDNRFGSPLHWTVENFNIPNGHDGIKAGLDKYSGNEALMLGVWYDRGNNTEGNLEDARIYRKVSLPAGTYYFGAAYNTNFNISNGYMFVSSELAPTADIPAWSLAFHPISQVNTNLQPDGLWFKLENAQDVYIGFQADLATGADNQEFRAERVALYRLD